MGEFMFLFNRVCGAHRVQRVLIHRPSGAPDPDPTRRELYSIIDLSAYSRHRSPPVGWRILGQWIMRTPTTDAFPMQSKVPTSARGLVI